MPNTDLLNRTLTAIENDPDDWDQENWRKCFAGKACDQAGGQWMTDDPQESELVLTDSDPAWCTERGSTFAGTRAYRVLGLDPTDSDPAGARGLFVGNNTLDDLRRIVAELVST